MISSNQRGVSSTIYSNCLYTPISHIKQMIGVVQIFDWYVIRPKSCNSTISTLQEMKSMSWQYIASGTKGVLFYSLNEFIWMNKYTPFEKRWKEFIELTDEIWKYKDVILSIDKIDKIEYSNNYNAIFKQWKYNKTNYIVVLNLEYNKELFKINLLDEYKIDKEFGLSTFTKNGTEIIFDLEPIDIIMIKYSKSSKKSNSLIIILVLIIIIIFIAIMAFISIKYLKNKSKSKSFNDSVSKLMNDNS